MKKHLIISAVALGLIACGSDEATVGPSPELEASRQGLMYAYPAHEQIEVPTPAPIVLRFSSPVVDSNPEMFITLRDADGNDVPYSIETGIGDGQGLVLTPDERLAPRAQYSVEIDGITLEKGDAQPRTLTFTTKGLSEGPRALVTGAPDSSGNFDNFELLRKIPDGTSLPILDFSSFRLQFNQPLDRTTVNYGSSVALEGPDGVVDAHLIVHGPYMTVDPKEDLTPGVEYTLSLQNDITSTYGETFPSNSYTFTPLDSGSRSIMTQEVAAGTDVSMLTGKPVNMVPLEAVLLGDDNETQQSGFLQAELAHIPTHPDFVPLRIKRGSMLSGTDMAVLIGGEVPAGFSSGEVKIHFISDAVGYLEENPYSQADNARRQLRLFMDVAITAEDPRANGAVTQDLMHLELIGTAEIRDGRLTADAVSVAEPRVLGSEDAKSVLSFFMQSKIDGVAEPGVDNTPLEVTSWNLGDDNLGYDKKLLYTSGDKIVINYNKPLDPDSVSGKVALYEQSDLNTPLDIQYYIDGSSLVIDSLGAVRLSEENDRREVMLSIDMGLEDVNGNSSTSQFQESFELPLIIQNKTVERQWNGGDFINEMVDYAPVILAAYPGYPCVIDESSADFSNGIVGSCAGGNPGMSEDDGFPAMPSDDRLPLMEMPKNRPILIVFSKDIDSSSVVYGETFIVEKYNNSGSYENVEGVISLSDRRLQFYPSEPWKDGALYRYILKSSGYQITGSGPTTRFDPDNNYTCDALSEDDILEKAVCDINGLPVQTQLLGGGDVYDFPSSGPPSEPGAEDWYMTWTLGRYGNAPDAGGPDFSSHFRGGKETNRVLQSMRGAPLADVNANFILDRNVDVITAVNNPSAGGETLGPKYTYDFEEAEPFLSEMDDHSNPLYIQNDPDGVKPNANTAKIFTLRTEGLPSVVSPGQALISDISIGCGFDAPFQYRDPIRQSCPEDKFISLTSAIFAEVTEERNENGDVKVLIWPSVIMASSVNMVAAVSVQPGQPFEDLLAGGQMAATGPQIMRMRYAKDQFGERNKPIEGWIIETAQGPIMEAEIDLYIDAPYVSFLGTGFPQSGSNLASYPITMNVRGPISFLEDGRMLIEQRNLNAVEIDLNLAGPTGRFMAKIPLVIPVGGSYLSYISEAIK